MSIHFDSSIKDPSIRKAIALIEENYKNDKFLTIIEAHGFFLTPSVTGKKIAQKLRTDDSRIALIAEECHVKNCPTTASTSLQFKKISLHSHALEGDRSLTQKVETLMHEYIHTLGYKHQGNGRNWINRKTAPYKVASLFVQFLKTEGKLA
jgi:hypothetical protein